MVTTEIEEPKTLPTHLQTVDEFEAWLREVGDDNNYEFVGGQIIPKPGMKQDEIAIAKFLLRRFTKTSAYERGDELLPETDSYVDSKRKRIPDLTYFSMKQQEAIRQGERVRTLFAIEILSESEVHEEVVDKIEDYFDGGAQLVWYIMPKKKKIEVYTTPDAMQAYKGTDVISAAPVLSDFSFTVVDLFA